MNEKDLIQSIASVYSRKISPNKTSLQEFQQPSSSYVPQIPMNTSSDGRTKYTPYKPTYDVFIKHLKAILRAAKNGTIPVRDTSFKRILEVENKIKGATIKQTPTKKNFVWSQSIGLIKGDSNESVFTGLDSLGEAFKDLILINITVWTLPKGAKKYNDLVKARGLLNRIGNVDPRNPVSPDRSEIYINLFTDYGEDFDNAIQVLEEIIQGTKRAADVSGVLFHEYVHYIQRQNPEIANDVNREGGSRAYYEYYMMVQSEVEAHAYQYAYGLEGNMRRDEWDTVGKLFHENPVVFMGKMYLEIYMKRINYVASILPSHSYSKYINFSEVITDPTELGKDEFKHLAKLLKDTWGNAHPTLMQTWNSLKHKAPSYVRDEVENQSTSIPVSVNQLFSV